MASTRTEVTKVHSKNTTIILIALVKARNVLCTKKKKPSQFEIIWSNKILENTHWNLQF